MKSKKKKLVVDKYTQPLYIPNNLFVLKNYSIEDVQKRFTWDDGDTIDIKQEYCACTLFKCTERKTGHFCIVVLLSKSLCTTYKKDIVDAINVCAHEASHVAHHICDNCSMQLNDETTETYAFITGWATECIYKTLVK